VIQDCPKQLFINNEWVNSTSGKTLQDINPSTEQIMCEVQHAGTQDVDLAVSSARKALTGAWGNMGPSERRNIMLKFADLIEKNAEQIAHIESAENGKPFS